MGTVVLLGGLALVHGSSPAYAAGPTNDNYASAITISGSSGSTTASNTGATTEAGEPAPTGNSWGASLWWSWTAPSTGVYLFDTCGSHIDSLIGIYTGSAVGSLTTAISGAPDDECTSDGAFFWPKERQLSATGGQTYRIQVAGDQKQMGEITLRWWSQSVPANDTSGSAITLTGASGHTTGTNRFATQDTDPSSVFNGVWWKWSPPLDGTYQFDTCGSNLDTKLGVYTLADSVWTAIVENDDSCNVGSAGSFAATTSTTYYIEVGGYSETEVGDIVLNWQADTPPVNDNLSAAIALPQASSGSTTGNNRFATTETGENDAYSGNTVWWTWTPTTTGTVVFDTCGSDFQTYLSAYTGSDLPSLVLVADDHYSCLNNARIMFDASAGTPYSIRVDGHGDGPGDIALHWQMGSAASNNDFANATSISGTTGVVTGNTMFATAQAGEPMTSNSWYGNLGGHSVWWTWTAPDNTPVNFNSCGSTALDNAVAVYTGSAVNALTEVSAGSDNACGTQGQASFTPVKDTVYHIVVDPENQNSMGDVALRWASVPDAPPQPSANFSNDEVHVSWSAPTVDNGTRITGYVIQAKTSDETHWSWTNIPSADTTSTTFTWMQASHVWDIRVAADTDSGVGIFSPVATVTVPGPPQAPDTPNATAGNGQVSLSWTAPYNGGSVITNYSVRYSWYANGIWNYVTLPSFPATTTSTTISPLANGTVYYFQVAAENAYGLGDWSASAGARPVGPPDAPSAPTIGTVTFSKGKMSVALSWTDNGNGGSVITDHSVQVYKYRAATKTSPAGYTLFQTIPTGSTGTSYTVTGLKNGTYVFTVAARSALGLGSYSGYSDPASR